MPMYRGQALGDSYASSEPEEEDCTHARARARAHTHTHTHGRSQGINNMTLGVAVGVTHTHTHTHFQRRPHSPAHSRTLRSLLAVTSDRKSMASFAFSLASSSSPSPATLPPSSTRPSSLPPPPCLSPLSTLCPALLSWEPGGSPRAHPPTPLPLPPVDTGVHGMTLGPLAGGFVSVFIPALAPALRVRALLPDPTVRGQ